MPIGLAPAQPPACHSCGCTDRGEEERQAAVHAQRACVPTTPQPQPVIHSMAPFRLSSLADRETLHKQKVKVKAKLKIAGALNVTMCAPIHT